MTFIPPMLCEILRDPSRLDDPRYVAEPKFDGQRAQIYVAGGRTVAAYSRRSLDLLRHLGLTSLREVRWPVDQTVLDGELCGETGLGRHSIRFGSAGDLPPENWAIPDESPPGYDARREDDPCGAGASPRSRSSPS